MTTQKPTNNQYNRREFVLASGLFVAGSLLACDKREKKLPIEHKQSTTKPMTGPILIRVLIAKNIDRVTIGRFEYTNTKIGEKPLEVDIKPNTELTFSRKTMAVSGLILLHPNKNNTFDVVIHVPIEQYLPGVLAGELFAHWHPATFAAQAVAARSYAVNLHIERKTKSYFDVTDGPSSQMFLGDVTLDVAHRAVKETNGVVLRWNSEVIPAYYSACCGGLAATAHDAISSAEAHNVAPLQGHAGKDACTAVKIHAWNVKRPARQLRKRLNACANQMNVPQFADIRSIQSIEPSATNQHGRPIKLTMVDRQKTVYEVRAKDFMRAANTTVSSLSSPHMNLMSSFLVGKKSGPTVELTGYGMGHGVGLCQYGAQELAGAGQSWQNILAWYYPKAEVNT